MKIKMIKTRQASLNGIQVRRFMEGSEYTEVDEVDISLPQYKSFTYGKNEITKVIIDIFLDAGACEIIEEELPELDDSDVPEEDVDILEMDEDGYITGDDEDGVDDPTEKDNNTSPAQALNIPIINKKKRR